MVAPLARAVKVYWVCREQSDAEAVFKVVPRTKEPRCSGRLSIVKQPERQIAKPGHQITMPGPLKGGPLEHQEKKNTHQDFPAAFATSLPTSLGLARFEWFFLFLSFLFSGTEIKLFPGVLFKIK